MTNRKTLTRVLIGSGALFWATTAMAQDPTPTDDAAKPNQPDAAANAAIAEAAALDDAQAKIELLQAQVEALREALEAVKASMVKATPSWKGAPLYEDKEAGWSFKPRGRIQYDAGYVRNPNDNIITRDLGFNTRVRSIRLGAEGTIPGDFGYRFEMDFSNSTVGFGDAILTYIPKGKPDLHPELSGVSQASTCSPRWRQRRGSIAIARIPRSSFLDQRRCQTRT